MKEGGEGELFHQIKVKKDELDEVFKRTFLHLHPKLS